MRHRLGTGHVLGPCRYPVILGALIVDEHINDSLFVGNGDELVRKNSLNKQTCLFCAIIPRVRALNIFGLRIGIRKREL